MPDPTAVRRGDVVLSVADLLRREHRRGRLLPLLRRAAVEALLVEQAKALNLSVEPAELQQTTDDFRRRCGLLSAEQTNDWLRRQRLSLDDFEAGLSERLLLAKLRRHVAEKGVGERFAANPSDYDRIRLRLALVPTEDLAREILSQIDEGGDLAKLAERYSVHPSSKSGGLVGAFRCQFSDAIRAAIGRAGAGALAGPVATPDGFLVLRVEEVTPAQLDGPTASFLARVVYDEWLRDKLKAAPLSAPLLGDPA